MGFPRFGWREIDATGRVCLREFSVKFEKLRSTMDGWNVNCSTCGEESARMIPLCSTSIKEAAGNIVSLQVLAVAALLEEPAPEPADLKFLREVSTYTEAFGSAPLFFAIPAINDVLQLNP